MAKGSKSTKRRRFTEAQKAKILAAAAETSVSAAAKRFKVGESQIYGWRRDASMSKNANAARATKAKPKVKAAKAKPRVRTRTRTRTRINTNELTNLKTENQQLRGVVIDQLLKIRKLEERA